MAQITQTDLSNMLALLELIEEMGYPVKDIPGSGGYAMNWCSVGWYEVTVANEIILVGHDNGHFVATGKIPGFPMISHEDGGISYRFEI